MTQPTPPPHFPLAPMGRFVIPAFLLFLIALQFWNSRDLRKELEASQIEAERIWQNSPRRFPLDTLSAPFYAPVLPSPLHLFDAGESAWLGQTLWIQLGRLTRAQDQPAYDYVATGRFLSLTAATALQIFIPAMALFFTWRMQQQGTLVASMTTWVSLIVQVFEAIAPGMALCCLAVGLLGWEQLGLGGASRLMLLLGLYVMYAAATASLCLAAFCFFENKTLATTVLAFFWCFNFTMARPVSANAAAALYPLPTLEQFARRLEMEVRNGYNGVEPKKDRERRFVQEALVEYKAKDIQSLPVNLSAVLLLKEENHQRQVFQRRLDDLRDQMQAQENLQGISSLVFPHVGVQIASAALSSSDSRAERAQQRSSDEQWGRIVDRVYQDVITSSGTEGKMVVRGPEYWRQIPFVRVQAASEAWSVQACIYPVLGMLLSLALCAWAVLFPATKARSVEDAAEAESDAGENEA